MRALRGESYGSKCDVWSLGVLLYELLTLRLPFHAANMPALIMQIVGGTFQVRAAVEARGRRRRAAAEARGRGGGGERAEAPPPCAGLRGREGCTADSLTHARAPSLRSHPHRAPQPLPAGTLPELSALVASALQKDPERRPRVHDILELHFVKARRQPSPSPQP